MEQPFSTSKVTVEYFDPHDVYKLVKPGLIPRLPLRNLHWQSHAGPLRSIETLHVELVDALHPASNTLPSRPGTSLHPPGSSAGGGDDGFTTQSLSGSAGGGGEESFPSKPFSPGYGPSATLARRHQIPGLRRTPYLKILFVRCDDNDAYKSSVRAEVREWIKEHTGPASSSSGGSGGSGGSGSGSGSGSGKKGDARNNNKGSENHDAFEWLIVHVVVPNTVAATQPRFSSGKSGEGGSDSVVPTKSSTSLWGKASSTILEKLRSDFNHASSSGSSSSSSGGNKSAGGYVDRIAQIRIGINDVPYDLLPRVVPAVPTGYKETEDDAKAAWADLIDEMKQLILTSFDLRVTQYEEDIKEKDAQRSLPGWNFCTFFILKEGLARGFESVGLVEDSLVGYDELNVGLDAIIKEQAVVAEDSPEVPGGSLLPYTEDLKQIAQRAMAAASSGTMEFEDEEQVDLQAASGNNDNNTSTTNFDDIPISYLKKPYRELILANNVSLFDFRCYIFARQISLLLRLGNAWSTREELVAKLREQQEAVLHGVAPRALPPTQADESEKLSMLAEICKRTLEFIPSVSHVMRRDIIAALMATTGQKKGAKNKTTEEGAPEEENDEENSNLVAEVAENIVASFAFSVAQQVLAQTLTKALPIPATTTAPSVTGGEENGGGAESKEATPDPKARMHPARTTSLRVGTAGSRLSSIPSPNFFPGPGDKRRASVADVQDTVDKLHRKAGMEELAARRAELYALSRNILEEAGRKRGWRNGWSSAPVIGHSGLQDASMAEMEEVDLNDDAPPVQPAQDSSDEQLSGPQYTLAGLDSKLLRTALDNKDDFYRLYEMLTDKALQHYSVADLTHSVLAKMSDLAVVKYHLDDYAAAASYFVRTTPFYGESGWSLLELSMLVMYSHCLRELERHDEYIRVVLKLLSKAATSEKERLRAKGSLRFGGDVVNDSTAYAEKEAFKDFLPKFLSAAQAFGKDVKHPLQNFFTGIVLEGTPVYDDGQDSFVVTVKLYSVLADGLPVDKAMLRLVTTGGARELWLENIQQDEQEQPLVLQPGRNKLRFRGTAMSPGVYEVDRIQLVSGLLKLNFERQAFVSPSTLANSHHRAKETVNLRHPYVALFQRADTLDLVVEASPVVQLDKNNAMDLTLTTGWNDVETCAIRIRSGTGGLRLLTSEAAAIGGKGPAGPQPETPEPGLFAFEKLAARSSLRFRIPFTTEQDVSSVSVKVEVVYTTATGGTYTLLKTPSIPLALKLGVNVQDVFKHASLFSRFTVSTSTSSPLRLFSSQLDESDVFEARHGVGVAAPTTNPVIIFPKQPASLLYQIKRKQAAMRITPKMQKTMHLRLRYSVLREEIAENIRDSLTDALQERDKDGSNLSLWQYSRLVAAVVLERVRVDMTAYDLERAAVLGEVPLGFLAEVKWREERGFYGLGVVNGEDVAGLLAGFIVGWAKANRVISAMRPAGVKDEDTTGDDGDGGGDTNDNNALETGRSNNRRSRQHTIIIPVDIPSMAVVHTADIRLQRPIPSLIEPFDEYETPVACVNQLLPATLHLKWTRIWDTERVDDGGGEQQQQQAQDDKKGEDGGEEEEKEEEEGDDDDDDDNIGGGEFSYEVNAPGDTWLVGGRKKGHFVIPSGGRRGEAKSSSPINEADIPLVMIPLREGHLPYPSVEVREVPQSSSSSPFASGSPPVGGLDDGGPGGPGNGKRHASLVGHCETDYRNLGETVRVVADRGRVTVSLDASGPGGGPLVLDSERVAALGGPEEDGGRPLGRVVA